MNARVINTLTKDASKAEEIALIWSIASHIDPGTYLASLFTPELVAWIEDRIKSDWTLDLLSEYQEALTKEDVLLNKIDTDRRLSEDRIKKLTKALDEQKSETERWIKNYRSATEDLLNRLTQERTCYEDKIATLQAALESVQAMQPCGI